MGHRIAKHIYTSANVWEKSTYYVRDAQGNVMSVYEHKVDNTSQTLTYTQQEKHIYGSSRVGMDVAEKDMITPTITEQSFYRESGKRQYELSNHLGNVLTVITDKKQAVESTTTTGTVDYFVVEILSANDYSPFGVYLQNRNFTGEKYRYGLNGQERDDEVKGSGNSYDFGARIYDSRLGRFLSVDPLAHVEPGWSPYRAFYCNPIRYIDPTGMLEDDYGLDKDGNITLLRETDDKTDKLIALDDKGAETDKSIEVEKGILDQKKEGTSSRGVSYDYYKVGNDEQATNLFEFVAQNSNVEWSQVKFGTKSNYVSTAHQPHSEAGGAHLLRELVIGKYTIREHIHSHPTSTEGPSGFKPHHKKTGDKDFANWVNKYAPRVQLKVYEKKTGKYIRYNHEKVFEP